MRDSTGNDPRSELESGLKEALASVAARFAHIAGEYLFSAYTESSAVEFKPPRSGSAANSNPVSATDRAVEHLIRERLAAEFPDDAVIGEEQGVTPGHGSPFVWVIDPLDGTTNFINGLPLFGASIGVLYQGWPVAGATWCASTHTFSPGIYHAYSGGPLQFAGGPLRRRSQGAWRGLASEPGRAPAYGALWDTRVLGCSTLEFALVAAGLLSFAYIPHPRLWDVVAGLVLLESVGCRALTLGNTVWDPLIRFSATADRLQELSGWSQPVLLGDELALERSSSCRASATP